MLELLYDMYEAEDQILSLILAQILKRAVRETWETSKKKSNLCSIARLLINRKMDQSTGYITDYQPYNWL